MNTKERLEKFLADTPIKPVSRHTIHGIEVYIADGFVKPEDYRGCNIRFGVPIERDIHPTGCFATIWHADSRTRGLSGVAYFHQFHDVNSISLSERQKARINFTLKEAEKALARTRLYH